MAQKITPDERQLLDMVSRERLWQDTEFLGSMYRASGSEEERASVKYIVDELERAGIDVTVYELDAYISYHKHAELHVLSPEQIEMEAVARAYTRSTPAEGVELEVVVAGEYDGDLADKAVLTARDWPNSSNTAGAGLQIHVQTTNEPNIHRGGGTGVWGTPTPDQLGMLHPQTPAINITRPDGERLRDLVRNGPVRIHVRTDVETGWRHITFPVATIPGKQNTYVLTGGHLDSHDPGVTDNATGCASLLELARIFNERRDQLQHGLQIGWWTGHESAGYAGSTWFCDHNWSDLRERCILYWNNDGPGIRDSTNIEGRYIFPQAQEFVLGLINDYYDRGPDLMAKPLKMGDQSFWGVGVPSASVYKALPPDHPDWAVVFGAGHGSWWHSTADTFDKADPDNLVDDSRFYALALWRLLTANALPFEFVTYGEWMQSTISELDEAIGSVVELQELISQVEEFQQLAQSLAAVSTQSTATAEHHQDVINGCLMRLSRHLNAVFFTVVGSYSQDLRGAIPGPAVRYPLPSEPQFEPRYFPGLQQGRKLVDMDTNSVEYPPLYTAVIRERNRAWHGLNQAIADIRTTLATIEKRSESQITQD